MKIFGQQNDDKMHFFQGHNIIDIYIQYDPKNTRDQKLRTAENPASPIHLII